jgi:transposase InsO family protein
MMILQVLIAMIAGWINRHQQQVIAYLLEENRTLHAKLGDRRIRFTDAERRRLAALAFPIGRKRLKSLATLATPNTLMRWYKQLVAQKFDSSQKRNTLGRPPVSDEIEVLVLQMANDNPTWGYRLLQGALANLGHRVDKITVRNILRRHHIDPAPKRRQGGISWSQFLKMHWEMLAATDFFTVEVTTWHGIVTYYVLVVMELKTRRVHLAGVTPHPDEAFMMRCARQLTDPFDGFLLDKRYLIHDRDTKFTATFDQYLRDQGVKPLVLPPQSPNLNAHCERFICSIKEETLNRMVFIGEGSLRYAIHQYLTHYHAKRNHQGLDNQLIVPEPEVGAPTSAVRRRERLGGLLSYYYREAA